MTATFLALLLAHLFADFMFQTDRMVQRKSEPAYFGLHIAIVFGLTLVALGGAWEVALIVAVAHLAIDATKTWGVPEAYRTSLLAFLIDQAAHIVSLIVVVIWWPEAFAEGYWANHTDIVIGYAPILAGIIIAVMVGGHAVGSLMTPYTRQLDASNGLENAGRMIGQLERALIFLFVLVGEVTAVGFLIAAKSVLRFDTAAQGQKVSEYVIIGTLASFGWALGTAFGTLELLEFAASSP